MSTRCCCNQAAKWRISAKDARLHCLTTSSPVGMPLGNPSLREQDASDQSLQGHGVCQHAGARLSQMHSATAVLPHNQQAFVRPVLSQGACDTAAKTWRNPVLLSLLHGACRREACLSCLAANSPDACFRTAMMTRAPAIASSRAISLPMPDFAPVMTAVVPCTHQSKLHCMNIAHSMPACIAEPNLPHRWQI